MKKQRNFQVSIGTIMKVSFFQFFLFIFSLTYVYGHRVNAQDLLNTRVDLNLEQTDIRTVLSTLEKKADVKFVYSSRTIPINRKVSINVRNRSVAEIITEIFKPEVVNYKEVNNRIILNIQRNDTENKVSEIEMPLVAPPVEFLVKGKVTDEKNEGLPAVSVTVKNTKTGTLTNENGDYELKVENGNVTLVFSSVGYIAQEVALGNRNTLNVVLAEDERVLEEVVVTALGIKKEEKALGYSIQKIGGDKIQKVAGVDVGTSLTGKVAGLLVRNSSDFASVPTVTIRGENPLIVIDGVPYQNKTLTDISAEDIESLNVLKGATASALYGFRGANGAILITTKNGSNKKGGISLDFTSNTMLTAGFLAIPEKQTLYGRGSNNTYDINSDNSWGVPMDGRNLVQWDPFEKVFKEKPYLPVGADNFQNFLEQGFISNNNLSVAYTNGKVSLRNSLNFIDNKGQYPNSTLNKYTYSIGGDINLDKLKISSNISYAKKTSPNISSNGYTSYDPMYTLLIWSSPDFNVLDYKDNYWITKGVLQNYTYGLQPDGSYKGASQNNPYFDRYQKTNEINRDIFNADVSVNYKLFPWLNATVRSGLDFYKEVGELRISQGSYVATGNTGVPGNPYTWAGTKTGGYVIGQNSGFSINTDALLTGDRSYKKFNFEYLAGGTIFFNRDDNMNAATAGGISIPEFFSIKASVTSPSINQTLYRKQVNSLFARLGVSWNKLLYLEATAREDWSSTLAKGNNSYFYPSIASSFVISELMPNTAEWLNLLKLRSSYTISKDIPGVYSINSNYSITNNTWNTLTGASMPSNLYPTDITPSAANTFETGLQGIFYNHRLTADVSYYAKKMYNGIITGPVSPATGFSGVYTNTKETTTRKGWEVILGGTPVKTRNLKWDAALNWSTYKRVYSALDPTYSAKKPWIAVGERVDVLASRDFLKTPAGDLIYNNGRLVYSSYDTRFGFTDPDWIWGFNNTVSYKNFTFYASLDGVVGGIMNTRTESYLWQSGNHPESLTPERAADVATPGSKNFLGNGVKVVSGTVTYDAFGKILTDTREFVKNDINTTYKQYVIDLHNSSAWGGNGSPTDTYSKSYLKLREIAVSYTLPAAYMKNVVKGATISLIGQNVFLWAKDFKYSDPDGGVEDFSDPSVRYVGAKLNLTF